MYTLFIEHNKIKQSTKSLKRCPFPFSREYSIQKFAELFLVQNLDITQSKINFMKNWLKYSQEPQKLLFSYIGDYLVNGNTK